MASIWARIWHDTNSDAREFNDEWAIGHLMQSCLFADSIWQRGTDSWYREAVLHYTRIAWDSIPEIDPEYVSAENLS